MKCYRSRVVTGLEFPQWIYAGYNGRKYRYVYGTYEKWSEAGCYPTLGAWQRTMVCNMPEPVFIADLRGTAEDHADHRGTAEDHADPRCTAEDHVARQRTMPVFIADLRLVFMVDPRGNAEDHTPPWSEIDFQYMYIMKFNDSDIKCVQVMPLG
ncbi:hypothetical protein DPMN_131227 [Dreissena polymorpha]|uniref:Uncharacterized protein n=1 Tax=Dreissena polymorpha TaxID=45954 RepID=A0A9D4K286_DREPO|nr:hypothetical protein DPMN_131227 [Dreissena polymorpha]